MGQFNWKHTREGRGYVSCELTYETEFVLLLAVLESSVLPMG